MGPGNIGPPKAKESKGKLFNKVIQKNIINIVFSSGKARVIKN